MNNKLMNSINHAASVAEQLRHLSVVNCCKHSIVSSNLHPSGFICMYTYTCRRVLNQRYADSNVCVCVSVLGAYVSACMAQVRNKVSML